MVCVRRVDQALRLDLTVCVWRSFSALRANNRHNINPTTPDQQFVDRGPQYRSAVFYHSPEQKAAAVRTPHAASALPHSAPPLWLLPPDASFFSEQEASRDALQQSGVFGAGVPLVTEITAASTFWRVLARPCTSRPA